ncbi:MAG TPA: fibronectin type III domain-containing protein [Verrucomicrobiae bacterium]|nr:fibronectin type III domain-containing protein [Verrucomicrobiae bacterium]
MQRVVFVLAATLLAGVPVFNAVAGPIVPAARQPVGALSGRVIFMNSGHGWTWSGTSWYLQRPTSLASMNEDYGNLDQLNFFAAYCFNAGAIVASMRPLGQQTNEVVLDNTNAAVTFAGSWNNSSSTYYFGTPGATSYRFASLNATETATATYTPTIPVAGYYPVYTWVKADTDRGDQLYRIRHTGGETQYRVPHYMVGNGWIYLGEYYFNAGSNSANGAVVISNLRSTTNGSVVIADAIRFGNGMGSINRGGGVSGYPREDESCRYWIQAGIGQGQSSLLYDDSDTDEHDSWHTPPLMSYEMTKTNGGGSDLSKFFKRVHISFHSNASTGDTNTATERGVEGLITGNPTPNQVALAQLCGQTVNDEMVSLGSPPLEYAWSNRGANITFSGGYSQISNTDFKSAMDATIIEVAYHDNTMDAALMGDPKVRAGIARAAMHAVVKYFNQFDTSSPPPLIFPPEPPSHACAIGGTNGVVALAWNPPASVANSGAPTNYVVYQSTNGYGFGNPISVGNVTNFTVTNLVAGQDYYFRISAANEGGESFPSEVVGCRPPQYSASPKVLFVNAFDRFDRTLDLKQNLVAQNYVPPGGSGGNQRVLPRRINSSDYVVPHGKAVSAYGLAFDSCHHTAVTNDLVALTDYPIVIWACGNESTADESFSAVEETKVTEFLANGESLFVSGAEIAYDLDRASGPTAADRNFLHNQLHAAFVAYSSSSWNFSANAASLFAGNPNGGFDDGSQGIYLVGFPDVIAPINYGAFTAINYSNVVSGAAGIFYNGTAGGGKVVYLGFPFETITSATARDAYMASILNFFNSGPLRFDSITALPGNQMKLAISGPAGVYTLQTAVVLNAWSPLANFTNTSGTLTFTNNANSSVKFFRVKSYP